MNEVDVKDLTDPYYNQVRCLIAFIQLAFSKRPKGSYRYVNDAEGKDSEIVIAGIKALTSESIPRIIVSRGPAQTTQIVMDNIYHRYDRTGAITRKALLMLPIGIVVIARIDTEAQEMAWFIQKSILANIGKIRKIGGFHKIDSNMSITPPTDFNAVMTPEPRSEASLVQVGFNTIVPYTYTVAPNDKPLLVRIKDKVEVDKTNS